MRRLLFFITFLLTSTMLMAVSSTTSQSEEPRKQLPTDWKVLLEKRKQLVQSGDINGALALSDSMANLAEEKGQIDAAATVRREKVTIIYGAQMDSLVITEAPKQMKWMEQHQQWAHYYRVWRLMSESIFFAHKPQTALHEAKKMLDYAQQRNDDQGRAVAYQMMGFIYLEIDNSEAIKAYEHSIQLLKNQDVKVFGELNRAYGYLCEAYENSKQYEKELACCEQWQGLLEREANSAADRRSQMQRIFFEFHLQKASALIGIGDTDAAAKELEKAEQINQQLNDPYYQYTILVRRSQLAFKSDDIPQAVKLSDRFAPMMDGDDWMMPRLLRADILLKGNRAHEAAEMYRSLYLKKDSSFSKEMRLQLDELNTLFHVDELEMKGQLQRSRFIILILVLVGLAAVIFLYFRYRSAKRLAKVQAEKERMASELRIARDIQMGMVPQTFPAFPDHPEIDLYASMTPAKEVGGDLYDYAIHDGRLYLCLGDVSGKGVPASLFMTTAVNLFRVSAQQLLSPAEIATQMNNTLAENNENGMFVTMFIATIDLATAHMDFCNAGHNPPIYGNGDVGGGVFLEMETNAPLGLWPGLEYVGESFGNISNIPFFIYSDGLNEAENRRHEQFGDDHILQLLKEHPFLSARQTVELMENEVERHADGAEQSDDLTILCLKLNINT